LHSPADADVALSALGGRRESQLAFGVTVDDMAGIPLQNYISQADHRSNA